MTRVRNATVEAIKLRHQGEEDVTVITQDALLSTFDRIFTALTLTLAGIASISLAVAGVLIMNVMLVSVSQRTSEVGLLKAIGATRGQITALFLTEAILLSVAGAITGLFVGLRCRLDRRKHLSLAASGARRCGRSYSRLSLRFLVAWYSD